jgi:transposase
VDLQYRLHHLPGSSARGRRAKKGHDGGTIDTKESQKRQALGRSRGGFTTKLHLITEGRGLPMTLHLTGGNIADCTAFEAVMAKLRLPRSGAGRPRTRPDALLGDKGYSSKKIRTYLRRRGITAVIPERKDQLANRKRKGSRGGRPPAFDRQTYKQRNLVETSKPQCCHTCGSVPSLVSLSGSVFMLVA